MTKRHVSLPTYAEGGLREFLTEVDDRLSSDEDTCDVVEDVLIDLHGDREAYERWQDGGDVSPAERVRLQGYDPCNATIESEYYAEKDEEKFTESKHLQWLWRQFDATPMADNVEFALRFRRMLADHLFASCGENCRFFKNISFTYGHNIEIGDNVVVHDDVRITYDSMVRAGVRVGENAVLAAKSIAGKDIPAHHVAAGTPAKSIAIKDGWESVAQPLEDANVDRREQRTLPYEVPEDLDAFDEFGRDLSPPGDNESP
jgi:acetyltransferase-like isoleucine patch superfamily enzyme